MKKLKVTQMTWGQARVRGIKKKEYHRRLRISASLKRFYETGIPKQKRKDEISLTKDRKRVRKKKKPLKRIRRQVAINFINTEATGYERFNSVRAVTINPEITERGLRMAIMKNKRIIEQYLGYGLDSLQQSYIGLEMEQISPYEDQKLNDMNVHLEIFVQGKIIKTLIVEV